MGPQEDNLFGRIALKQGYVSQRQLDECVEVQRNAKTSRLLGAILIEKGFLSQEQLRKVMVLQKQTMSVPAKDEAERQADVSFGFIAIQSGVVSSEQVYECVQEQVQLARRGLYFRLGEVFVTKRYMTPEQVRRVLDLQQDYLIVCERCGTRYNALRYEPGQRLPCTHCGTIVQMPRRLPAL